MKRKLHYGKSVKSTLKHRRSRRIITKQTIIDAVVTIILFTSFMSMFVWYIFH